MNNASSATSDSEHSLLVTSAFKTLSKNCHQNQGNNAEGDTYTENQPSDSFQSASPSEVVHRKVCKHKCNDKIIDLETKHHFAKHVCDQYDSDVINDPLVTENISEKSTLESQKLNDVFPIIKKGSG